MITVSMQEWFRTGIFGPVRLGMSRAQVQELLGPPDDVGGTSRKYRTPSTWKYGDIEFYFGGRDDPLQSLFTDTFQVPSGGHAIALDPWIVRRGIRWGEVERQLVVCGIEYRGVDWPFNDNTTRITVGPCVVLTFVDRWEPYSSPPGLSAIGCTKWS